MFSRVFLAVTEKEMDTVCLERTAYMACHFSPGGSGLSNIPRHLPEDSIVLLDDSMPVQGHDPQIVIQQLKELAHKFSFRAVLLDFQRPPTDESRKMVNAILQNCNAAVTPAYAKEGFPVFLPPPPVNKPLAQYLEPWKKNGVFLELAAEGLEITVTKNGSKAVPLFPSPLPLKDQRLHCHYGVKVFPGRAVFTLCRTRQDLFDLVAEAEELGVLGTVGLYQELKQNGGIQ